MAAHLLVTDSGLGGLGICAGIERALRTAGCGGGVRITYFNAWPEEGGGYNSLPDETARLAYFDRALFRMQREQPDRIVIACNTLSVLFPRTAFARDQPTPVVGIIDTGVDSFFRSMAAAPGSRLAVFGTRITIESGVHRDALIARGIDSGRIAGAGCHGLAGAIESNVDGPAVDALIRDCVAAIPWQNAGGPLFAGLCCTHFGYVADRFREALVRHTGQPVTVLDPNQGLVDCVAADVGREATSIADAGPAVVSVLSKVRLTENGRQGIGRLVAIASPATAEALTHYRHVPDLF